MAESVLGPLPERRRDQTRDEIRDHILSRLSDSGGAVSGDVLATELGLSRVAIWKHINKLRQQGIEIVSRIGVGYELHADLMHAPMLAKALKTNALKANAIIGRQVLCFAEVDSTNSEAMRLIDQASDLTSGLTRHDNVMNGTVICADRQTQGRGRLGRPWLTMQGSLALCVILQPPVEPARVTQIPLLVAVALQQALQPWVPDIRIKWPNDLVVHGAKLSGILTEMRSEPGRVHAVVIGIGINMRAPENGWQAVTDTVLSDNSGTTRKATDIASCSKRPASRQDVAVAVLKALDIWYQRWLSEGFGPVKEAWWQHHAASGSMLRVVNGHDVLEGVAEALDDDGALMLRSGNDLVRVTSGDVDMEGKG